jgi:hypothetical protein
MNEILQWIVISALFAVIAIPPAVRIWRDFKEEEEDD